MLIFQGVPFKHLSLSKTYPSFTFHLPTLRKSRRTLCCLHLVQLPGISWSWSPFPNWRPQRRIRWTSDFNFWKAPNFWREMEKSNFQAASNNFCLAGVNLTDDRRWLPDFHRIESKSWIPRKAQPNKACSPNNDRITHKKVAWLLKNQPNHIHWITQKHHTGHFSNSAYMSLSQRRKLFTSEATSCLIQKNAPRISGPSKLKSCWTVDSEIQWGERYRIRVKQRFDFHSFQAEICLWYFSWRQTIARTIKTHAITFWEVPRVFSKKSRRFSPVWNHDRNGHRINFPHTLFWTAKLLVGWPWPGSFSLCPVGDKPMVVLGCPGMGLLGSKVIGSMGYFTYL